VTAFAHPALFWTGLGLVSVPILIHLFFRRRHRVVRWAAMDFLLAALKKQKRRIEVENLLLLLLRCAAILLLGLAVARPAVEAAGLNPFGGAARAVVVVVDTSGSMAAQHTGQTALERARERAARMLDDLPGESRVTLLVSRDETGRPRALLENATPDEAQTRLSYARLSYGPNDLGSVFRLAGEKVAALPGRRLIVLLTDLQRRDWRGSQEDVRRALQRLEGEDGEDRPAVTILDVGVDEPANVGIVDFTVDAERRAFSGELLGLSATLRNFGDAAASGTLALYVARADGQWEKSTAEEVPALKPNAKVSRVFHHLLPAKRDGPVRFKTTFTPRNGAADRLLLDSERYLALRVRPPVRILPVRTYERAMEILRDIDFYSVIEIANPIAPSELEATDLSNVDVLLWADAEFHELEDADRERIERFVRRGGGLLAFLGQFALPDQVNARFFADKGRGLFPMLLVEGPDAKVNAPEDNPFFIDLAAKRTQEHPLFVDTRRFAFSPDIWVYRRIKWAGEPQEEKVVARYTTGDPAVLTHDFGSGRVVVVTTTPDERYFKLNGSVLPIVFLFNAAHYLVPDDAARTNLLVGRPIRLPLSGDVREAILELPEEAGGTRREPVAEVPEFVFGQTSTPGFYRLTFKGVTAGGSTARPTEEVHDVAVNLDAGEGDLRRISTSRLKSQFLDLDLSFTDDVESILPRTAAGDRDDLSRMVLGGVVLLLFLELFLAWRFGRRRRAT